MSCSDAASGMPTISPADVRAEQANFCARLYSESIAQVIFADPLAYNELNGKLIGEFQIPLNDARKYSARICEMIAHIIEEETDGWTAIVTHALNRENKYTLYVVLQEK